jgi:TfoX N-terminal domain
MAYDERLAERIRHVFGERRDVTERKMFGGLAFLLQGRMCCGIVGSELMVRVTDDEFDAVMRDPHVRPMDFTGKPLRGFVYVASRASARRRPSAPGCRAGNGSRGKMRWHPRRAVAAEVPVPAFACSCGD